MKTICIRMAVDFDRVAKTVAERLGQDAVYGIDSSKARHEFGWQPEVTFEEGISGVIKWV